MSHDYHHQRQQQRLWWQQHHHTTKDDKEVKNGPRDATRDTVTWATDMKTTGPETSLGALV